MALLAPTLTTARLIVSPLRIDDASEMATALDALELHEFIGGAPLDQTALRARFSKLVAGSLDPKTTWLNWTLRLRETGVAIGSAQATIYKGEKGSSAQVAWTVGLPWQRRGFATEAARAIVAWLRESGVDPVAAMIHPNHQASQTVATRCGLAMTAERIDGEQMWSVSS
jgi:RimJ/RimL family protein N-acetyltransferase